MKSGTEVCDCSWISPLSSPSRKTAASKKFPESTHRYNEDSEDVLGSSPTSVVDNFLQNANKMMNRSNNTVATSLVASESKTKIKTLIKGYSWDLPAETKYASEVKKTLSSNSSIATKDIMLISNGREVSEDMEVPASKVIYAMVRAKASSEITLKLCVNNGSAKANMEFTSSIGSKVYQIKRELRKICKMSEFGMRCIIGGRVLRDENILGDYVLSTALGSKVQNKRAKEITLYVNKTIDLKRDVDIHFHLMGGSVIKSYFDIKSPSIGLLELLRVKAPFPSSVSVNFCIELSRTLVRLDADKCLFDYGVTGDKVGQIVDVFVVPSDVPVPSTRDLSSNLTARLNPRSLFPSMKQSDSKNNSEKKVRIDERKKDVDSVCQRADSLARAIALKTKLRPEKNAIANALGGEAKKAKVSDGGLFSKMKKGFLAKSKVLTSKKPAAETIVSTAATTSEIKTRINYDLMNPYDDPDSPLNQMD